jgi:hypothetical protein
MSANAIYDAVCKRTEAAFGFRVNPHRFRHAAGTLWSIEDPENVRGVRDLLGHASFDKTTEAHYPISQSRIAGRALAKAISIPCALRITVVRPATISPIRLARKPPPMAIREVSFHSFSLRKR